MTARFLTIAAALLVSSGCASVLLLRPTTDPVPPRAADRRRVDTPVGAVEVFVESYPGYGGSQGPARLDAIPGAALAVYEAIARRAEGRPIVVAGHSLGATTALFVASRSWRLRRPIVERYGGPQEVVVVASARHDDRILPRLVDELERWLLRIKERGEDDGASPPTPGLFDGNIQGSP